MTKTILSPVLTHLTYILGPKDSFCAFYLYYWSEIMPSYYPFQFPENFEKSSFGPDFGLFDPNLDP